PPGEGPGGDDAPAGGRGCNVGAQIVAADQLDRDVDGAGCGHHAVGERLRVELTRYDDGVIEPEPTAWFELLLAPRRADDPGAPCVGELDRGRAHTGGGRVHQHHLAGLERR